MIRLKELCWKACVAEALGTMVLVLVACGVAVFTGADIVATALAFGLVIVAMAYSIGPISGCHINPAVSLGFAIRGKMGKTRKENWLNFGLYVGAQFAGAIIGAAILFGIVKLIGNPYGDFLTNLGSNGYVNAASGTAASIAASLIIEILLTFVFVFAILGVTRKSENGRIAGMVIGLTLVLVHLVGIPLTGTSVNPARSFGPALFAWGSAIEQVWVFIVGPMIGAALAGLVAHLFFKKEDKITGKVK